MTSLDIIAAAPLIWFAALAMGLLARLVNGIFGWLVKLIG